MRRTLLLLALMAALLLACTGVVLAQSTNPTNSQSDSPKKTKKEKISGSYIVVLNDTEDPDQVAEKKKQEIGDLKVKHVYKNALKGFTVEIPDQEASKLRDNPEVKYVEQDQVATATAQNDNPKNSGKRKKPPSGGGGTTRQPQQLPWGIDKIDADLSSTLAGNGSGTVDGVKAYIIDTGIDTTHPDLNVSTTDGVSYINDSHGINDCAGHGTHVAGTVAAKDDPYDVVGVAPSTQLVSVRVLNCQGLGTYSDVIAGVDWVTQHAAGTPAIANMSLGGGLSQALNDAVAKSAAAGIFYSLAAGNDGAGACNSSPAAAGVNDGVMTVGATDSSDHAASWSNYGPCVDIWAPGVSILSTKNGGGTTTMSGTSMASPHVGGGGALYRSKNTDDPKAVEAALKSAAQSTGTQSKDGRAITREYVKSF
jgi:subtilisin family serine protease